MKTNVTLFALGWLLSLTSAFAQPNAPSELAGSAAAYNQINLTWKDNSTNEAKFEIERKDFVNFTKIGETGANATTYQDKTVQANGSYTYRVRAVLATGAGSRYSNEISVNTPQEPPGVPTGLSASVQNGNSIRLTWNNGPGGTASDYQIERGSSSGGPFSLLQTVVYSRTPSFTDNGVSGGQQYCYRVRARNGGGTSDFTGAVCQMLPLAPTNVVNLKATAQSSSSIKLTWSLYGKESAITIERRRGQSGNFEKIKDWLADSGEFTDTGLESGAEYCYRIGESGREYSAVVCATTQQSAPNAPARLQVQAVAYNQVNLQWADLSNNETGFQIERAEGGPTAAFTKIADVGANATSYSDQSVQGSKQYCYRVRAVNGVGVSNYTDTQCATTPAPPVGVPQNLAASAASTTQINLTWTGVAGASGYQLERSLTGNDPWQKLADPVASATSYSDPGLTPNTRYYYRLRALNSAGVPGGYSNVADALTPDTPPAAPARLAITAVSYNRVSLQWADLSGNESGFQVERSTNGTTFDKIADLPANATTYNDQTVAPQTRYYYRVRAVNAAGPSPYSNVADTTTPVGPPAAPQNLAATATSTTQISLTWGVVATADNILIERSPDGNSGWNQIASVANATSYADNGLTPNVRYYYRIRATNVSGTSPYSNVANASTPDVPPAAPARLTATVISPNQINLQWTDLSTNESGFEVERGSSATTTFSKVADLPANATTYEDKTVADATQYCYRVRAKNAAGPSPYTDAACATTPLAPPATPNGLTAQLQDYDQIRLDWSALSPKAATVSIERATNPNGPFQEIKQQPAASVGYLDIGLQEFTTYFYRIRTTNAAGNSAYSNVASARVNEVVIAVEDELETHTTLYVSDRTLHVITNWFGTYRASLQLLTTTGRSVLTESRKVNPVDRWQYDLHTLPTGLYLMTIVADGRKLTKRILLP